MFWLNALKLLDSRTSVTRVAFETGPKAFDDILVEYDPDRAPRDHEGHEIYRKHIQCKWHTRTGSFGFTDLTEPEFINASKFSILERALKAQMQHAPDGIGCQFILMTNWRIHANDPLQSLVRARTRALDLSALFDSRTDRSRMGNVRKLWCEHLGVDHAALRIVARTLGMAEKLDGLDDVRERLDDKCAAVGLRRIPTEESACLYDDLFWKLLGQGRIDFDRESFAAMVAKERLIDANPDPARPLTVGVKSFVHKIDDLESRCDRPLNLVPHFDGRYIRNSDDWQRVVYPQLESFILEAARSTDELRLILDAHVSLAFAIGSVLNFKSGKEIEIEQRTSGRRWWSMDDAADDAIWPSMIVHEEVVDDQKGEIAIAVGLTHDVSAAVSAFAREQLNQVGRVLHCKPEVGPSQKSVTCGRHAWILAENIVRRLRSFYPDSGRAPLVHLFIAGPNGFSFFLGQHQQAIGPTAVYEWDFDGLRGGGYSLGLTVW